jgi:cellulose synthase/poly-beta-1,6-N-acetylglucosamine synthase-like glycosyltransferase
MNDWLSWSVQAPYYPTLGILAYYGTHRMVLLWAYWRTRRQAPPRPPEPNRWPMVTVQLPMFNEKYVVGRLLQAVSGLDYPRDRLEIQVRDDSTDETRDLVAELVGRLRREGFNIHHFHRPHRLGY